MHMDHNGCRRLGTIWAFSINKFTISSGAAFWRVACFPFFYIYPAAFICVSWVFDGMNVQRNILG